MTRYYIGVDLGLPNEYTGISIVEQVTPPRPDFRRYPLPIRETKRREYDAANHPSKYVVKHVEHVHMKTTTQDRITYKDIAERLTTLTTDDQITDAVVLLNATNVGGSIIDGMMNDHDLSATVVTITAGNDATTERGSYLVPYLDMTMSAYRANEERRINVAKNLRYGEQLRLELLNASSRPLRQNSDLYSMTHASEYADLFTATAIAVWYAERHGRTAKLLPHPFY